MLIDRICSPGLPSLHAAAQRRGVSPRPEFHKTAVAACCGKK
jgi:hypothetical protein